MYLEHSKASMMDFFFAKIVSCFSRLLAILAKEFLHGCFTGFLIDLSVLKSQGSGVFFPL